MSKIAILLPYKENFSVDESGAASIWVKDYLSLSKFSNSTIVYGFLKKNKKPILSNFRNLDVTNFVIKKNIKYTEKFYEEYL